MSGLGKREPRRPYQPRSDRRLAEPWLGFAGALHRALVVGAAIAILTAAYAAVVLSAGDPAAVVSGWYSGADAEVASVAAAPGADAGRFDSPEAIAAVGMVALLLIPIVAYGVLLAGYLRHRRRAYAVMATLQLLILAVAALGLV